MMDAVRFLKERARMCEGMTNCSRCKFVSVESDLCLWDVLDNPSCDKFDEAVTIVEKWSAEHPVKTRLMDFLERMPFAPLKLDGYPLMWPKTVGYCQTQNCAECQYYHLNQGTDCWNLPLEE